MLSDVMATPKPNSKATVDDGVEIDFKEELEELKKQSEGLGRYMKPEVGRVYDLTFTGKAKLVTNKWGNEQYQFETTEKNDSGQTKVLPVTKNSPFARELLETFMNGTFRVSFIRTGSTQQDTRYQIIKK